MKTNIFELPKPKKTTDAMKEVLRDVIGDHRSKSGSFKPEGAIGRAAGEAWRDAWGGKKK